MDQPSSPRTVRVYREPETGLLWFKLPQKGARWHKGLKDMTAVAKAIDLERSEQNPIEIEYITTEELDH